MVQISHNLDGITQGIVNKLQAYAAHVERDLDEVMGQLSASLDGHLKEYTPVDTGALRAAWERERAGYAYYQHRNPLPYARVVNDGGYRGVGPKTHEEGPQTFPGGISVEGGIFASQRPSHMVERALSRISLEVDDKLSKVLKQG